MAARAHAGIAFTGAVTAGQVIYTVGYEGRAVDEFVASLREAGIGLVADVRETPISRKRGFSKSALAQALAESGIEYTHLKALGCPKPVRDGFKEDRDWARYTRGFMQHLGRQQPALQELARLTGSRRTALLCFEENFNWCHRTYVARAVALHTGASIRHLTKSGVLVEDVAVAGVANP
jgi:uncharacterized protein (DUF488 family)